MGKVTKTYTNGADLAKRLHNLVTAIIDELRKDYPKVGLEDISGNFYETYSAIGFDNMEEYKDVVQTVTGGTAMFFVSFKEDEQEKFSETVVRLSITVDSSGELELEVRRSTHTLIDRLFVVFEREFPECKPVKFDPDQDKKDAQIKKTNNCTLVLTGMPDYQSRITAAFADEKDLQNFVYPILKSHFADLVDEDYLPKVAGSSSKPDFAIPSARLVIECKFLRKKDDYKSIKDQIASDLVGYFGADSPYERMVVFIYNSTNKPMPSNYIQDIEAISDKIVKVIISPGMQPA